MKAYITQENKIHIEKINQQLFRNIDSTASFIKEIGEYILAGNGKLLRPLLFILS
ncbi:MAG: heptaprenyl diphosphate synthase, partial [Deltaproteobacteria bacterium]